MDIPLAYIIFEIMISLKENNKNTLINRDNLIIYLKRMISSFDLDKELLEDLIFDFNFGNELDFFLDDYNEYFEMEEGNIRLISNVNINELRRLQKENVLLEDYDKEFINDVNNVIHNDIAFLEIIGVRPNIDVYKLLLELEEKLENKYLDLSYNAIFSYEELEKIRNEIKMLKIIINIMYININNNFSTADYNNLYLYAKSCGKIMPGEEMGVKLYYEPNFDRNLLINTPMDKALFINDTSAKGVIEGRLNINKKKNNKTFNMQDMAKLNFYLAYLELLDNEIDKTKDMELNDELTIAKYRLMYVLDSMYDLMNYNRKEEFININCDYNFMTVIVYFFIFEVLNYEDKDYKLEDSNKKDIITYYFNIIKKLYVETYYKLTNDENIIGIIKNNKYYDKNKISTKMFDSFIDEDEKKKVKKRDYIK